MGFLKKIFRNVFRDGMPAHTTSSFEHLSEEELEAHLGVTRYGNFTLSGAVRPSYDLQVASTSRQSAFELCGTRPQPELRRPPDGRYVDRERAFELRRGLRRRTFPSTSRSLSSSPTTSSGCVGASSRL